MDFEKNILLNPGPVMISDRVRETLNQPDICHREEEFYKILRQVREKILQICDGNEKFSSAVFTGSGTSALESVVSLLSNVEGKILIINNGAYGERIKNMAKIYDAEIREMKFKLDDPISLEKIESVLKKDESIDAIAIVHHETTTGMLNPLQEIGKLTKKYGKILFVDSISSVGAEKLSMVEDNIDFCVGVSNKCIQSIPGVSFVCFKKGTLEKFRGTPRKGLYLDLLNLWDYQKEDDTPFTPAVQAFNALNEALDELLEETVEGRRKRYSKRASELREGLVTIGFESLLSLDNYSSTLSTFKLPADIGYGELHDELKKRGFVIYAPKEIMGKNMFRIANMGELNEKHTERFIKNMRSSLRKLRKEKPTQVVILAAGMGRRLGKKSKPLLEFSGKTLIERNISNLSNYGLENITIVTGYKEEKIRKTIQEEFDNLNLTFISNQEYESSGSGYSLSLAKNILGEDDFVLMDADILYDKRILNYLLNCPYKNVTLVDPESKFTGEEVCVFSQKNEVTGLAKEMRNSKSHKGEALGMYKFSKQMGKRINNELNSLIERKGKKVEHETVLDSISSKVSIYPRSITSLPWIEIDTEEDLKRADTIFSKIKE